MSEIKQREKVKGTIKTIDKGRIATDKVKSNIVSIKERGENSYGNTNENSANEYAVNRLRLVENLQYIILVKLRQEVMRQ